MQQGLRTDSGDRVQPGRLNRTNRASSVAFFLGGSLFAIGAYLAQTGIRALETVNLTYLVGGFFFSLGGFALILLVNMTTVYRGAAGSGPVRWWRPHPHQPGWLSATVLFGGTLLFAVSLVAAFAQHLTPRQSNGWIWFPDILGCVCFLVSGHLALRDLRVNPWGTRVHSLDWWVAAVNQVGSILFFLAGLAAFTRPATASAVNTGLVNWGTFAGAVCFAIGGVLQVVDNPVRPEERSRDDDDRAR